MRCRSNVWLGNAGRQLSPGEACRNAHGIESIVRRLQRTARRVGRNLWIPGEPRQPEFVLEQERVARGIKRSLDGRIR